MNDPLLNSVTVIGAALVVIAAVASIHWAALRICPPSRRFHYLLIYLFIAIPCVFILLADGSGHVHPIILWDCYHLMVLRVFRYNQSGFDGYDWGIFGLPILHQLVSVTAAALITRTMPDKVCDSAKTPIGN